MGRDAPVPEHRLRVLDGGETIDGYRVAYTPGHASHHVAYLHEASGTALCGDVAGVRIGDGPLIAPTPPPDIDVERWQASLAVLAAWAPERVALTHFGSFGGVPAHLARLREELGESVGLAAELDAEAYGARMAQRFAASGHEASYAQAAPPPTLHPGLARYLDKR